MLLKRACFYKNVLIVRHPLFKTMSVLPRAFSNDVHVVFAISYDSASLWSHVTLYLAGFPPDKAGAGRERPRVLITSLIRLSPATGIRRAAALEVALGIAKGWVVVLTLLGIREQELIIVD